MKNFFFNCQAKGGTGKSMLTYLQGLKHEDDIKSAFIDLDSSTQTSSRQLAFLFKEEKPDRLFTVDIFDSIKKIERERLIKVIESFSQKSFDNIFIDFGAPESEQLPTLLTLDFSPEEFKDFEEETGASFIFNVLVCGGTSFSSTSDYLKKLANILDGKFPIVVYANMFTFKEYTSQLDQLINWSKKAKAIDKVVEFGDIEVDRSSGQKIIDLIKDGQGKEGYKNEWMARTKIKRRLAEI